MMRPRINQLFGYQTMNGISIIVNERRFIDDCTMIVCPWTDERTTKKMIVVVNGLTSTCFIQVEIESI